jgi:hypothetical protein
MKLWKRLICFSFALLLFACGGKAPQQLAQPSLTSIIISPATSSYKIPTTQQYSATGNYSDGSTEDITQSVTWNSSDASVVTIGNSVGSKGMATMVGSGSADISAASGSVQTTIAIIVTSSVTISVAPSFAPVTVSFQTTTFTAAVQGSNNTSVTWAVDGVVGGNSTIGTISNSGVYTPPSTKGFHTITATSGVDLSQSASAQVAVSDNAGVFTRGHNNALTSENTDEIVLTPQNVNESQFGKLFSYAVDGGMYAQPLYVANVKLPDNTYHNIVYVATTNDTVYAFDADNPAVGILWMKRLIDVAGGETTVPCGEETEACTFYGPVIGITGTPVIDPQTGTMYVATFSEINGTYYHKLHALDITTGDEKSGSPVIIQGSVAGTGSGGDGTTVTFDPYQHLQRPSLLLANGNVYVGFASYGDAPPYHGWLFAYDAKTLNQVATFNATPDGYDGPVWQSGASPAADEVGNIYVMTGNGDFNADTSGGRDYGDSFIKLSPLLAVEDYFTPYNQASLDTNDADLGSGGPVLLPDQSGPNPHLVIGAGKEGTLYLLDRDNLGGYNSVDNSQIVQSISGETGNIFSNVAYWNGKVYVQGWRSALKMFTVTNGMLSPSPTSQASFVSPFPGATPAISSNDTKDGIAWTLEPAAVATDPMILRAYDANDVSVELYDSNQAANNRDAPGSRMKFQVPVVVNGKVYIATQGQLDVYGLLP